MSDGHLPKRVPSNSGRLINNNNGKEVNMYKIYLSWGWQGELGESIFFIDAEKVGEKKS